MNNHRNGAFRPGVIGGVVLAVAAGGAAAFVVAKVTPDSASWANKMQNYLISIANYEQASPGWLHPEFASVQAYEDSLIKPVLKEGFSQQSAPNSTPKSIESATSKTLTLPLSAGYFTHSFHQQKKDAIAEALPPQF